MVSNCESGKFEHICPYTHTELCVILTILVFVRCGVPTMARDNDKIIILNEDCGVFDFSKPLDFLDKI